MTIDTVATPPSGGSEDSAKFTATFPKSSFSATRCPIAVVNDAAFFGPKAFTNNPGFPRPNNRPSEKGENLLPPPAWALGWGVGCKREGLEPIGVRFLGDVGNVPASSQLSLIILWSYKHGSTLPRQAPWPDYRLDNQAPNQIGTMPWSAVDSGGGYLNFQWKGRYFLEYRFVVFLMYRPPRSGKDSIWVPLAKIPYAFNATIACVPNAFVSKLVGGTDFHWKVAEQTHTPPIRGPSNDLTGETVTGEPTWRGVLNNGQDRGEIREPDRKPPHFDACNVGNAVEAPASG